jgi:hypothetical protein
MECALYMQQSGYKFLPEQNSIKNQIAIVAKWVGMDHMHPNVVSVKLPGQRDDDYINVTTFYFIHQFHSLLLDPLLNIPDNLVLNATDAFAQYVAPDGCLGKCLSGSWYRHAWTLMEENQLGDFMIPIILYIDKTCMSLTRRLSTYQVRANVVRDFHRGSSRSSQCLVPTQVHCNRGLFYSAAHQDVNEVNVKNERMHVQLDTILSLFKTA